MGWGGDAFFLQITGLLVEAREEIPRRPAGLFLVPLSTLSFRTADGKVSLSSVVVVLLSPRDDVPSRSACGHSLSTCVVRAVQYKSYIS